MPQALSIYAEPKSQAAYLGFLLLDNPPTIYWNPVVLKAEGLDELIFTNADLRQAYANDPPLGNVVEWDDLELYALLGVLVLACYNIEPTNHLE